MLIRQYIPLALAVLAIACAFAYNGGASMAPIVIILLGGETLIAFKLEDYKLVRAIASWISNLDKWDVMPPVATDTLSDSSTRSTHSR